MNELTSCPVCSHTSEKNSYIRNSINDTYDVDCKKCGIYIISNEMLSWPDLKEILYLNRSGLSGLIRYFTDNKIDKPIILSDTVNELLENPIIPKSIDIEKKSKYLLENLKRRTTYFGEQFNIHLELEAPIAFAKNEEELSSLLNYLAEKSYIFFVTDTLTKGVRRVSLTAKGFNLENRTFDTNQVFIASWFADSQDEAIETIEKAIESTDYSPMCIKSKHFSETILEKGLGEIRKSAILVADLTGLRSAVIYEIAFANALRIPVILVRNSLDEISINEFYTGNYKINYYKTMEELSQIVTNAINSNFPKLN